MDAFESYQSPFSWRYGSPEMRGIWGEKNRRRLWRKIWVALAEVQSGFGLVRKEQLLDLKTHQDAIDLSRSLEIESEIHHDLMAELTVFAEQCPQGAGILHLGATSMDIKDNALVLQMQEALQLIQDRLKDLLESFLRQIDLAAGIPIIAFTHLQPAEPTTLGYRLAGYAQDLLDLYQLIDEFRQSLKGKGFTGAVGTSASFAALLGREQLPEFQRRMEEKLALPSFPIVSQTYPRRQDLVLLNHLSGLGAVLYKFAFDLRFLQSPMIGELAEPFGESQVGSSAMPFKKNPIQSEKINSLGRWLAQMPRAAWDNAAHSLLERTLDDSANRRTLIPEAFLITDELLIVSRGILVDLAVFEERIQENFSEYAPFAALEPILMALSKAGANRQEMHALLQRHAYAAWSAIQQGRPNPLQQLLREDECIQSYLPEDQLLEYLKVSEYLGDAARRVEDFLMKARNILRVGRIQ